MPLDIKALERFCEAIMDPIAVTALLYKLNIVKLQLYISFVAYLLYHVKGSLLMIPVTCV